MVRKESESMPKAEPITNTYEEPPLPQENLVEYVRLKGINMIALHGSNNGTAEKYANEICEEAEGRNYHCLAIDAEELFADDLPRLSEFDNLFVVFLMATYDGKPPSNVKKMYDWLHEESNFVPDLKYAVFGVGDKSYGNNFNSVAKYFDERLEALGGKRLASIGLGDHSSKDSISSTQEDFKDWRKKLWNEVNQVVCAVPSSKCDDARRACWVDCKKRPLVDRINEEKATILIVYASESKKAKSFSEDLKKNASKHGFNSLSIPAAELKLEDIAKLSQVANLVLLLCMPTNCDGKPYTNTGKFFDWIQEGKVGLDGLRYSIFGLGNTKHEDFNGVSKQLNEKMVTLGGNRVYDLGLGNDDDTDGVPSMKEDFEKWSDGLWTAIKQSCD